VHNVQFKRVVLFGSYGMSGYLHPLTKYHKKVYHVKQKLCINVSPMQSNNKMMPNKNRQINPTFKSLKVAHLRMQKTLAIQENSDHALWFTNEEILVKVSIFFYMLIKNPSIWASAEDLFLPQPLCEKGNEDKYARGIRTLNILRDSKNLLLF